MRFRSFLCSLILCCAALQLYAQDHRADSDTFLRSLLPEAIQQSGLRPYYRYEEALEAAEKAHKPLLLYFTGVNNVVSRYMDKKVLADPEVLQLLQEDFMVAMLYCDYNDTLDMAQQYRSRVIKKQVVTLGDRNQDIETTYFDAEAQPFCIFIDSKNRKLAPQGYAYNPDPKLFVRYLQMIKTQYKKPRP